MHFDGAGRELCVSEFMVLVGVKFLGFKINLCVGCVQKLHVLLTCVS
jgi:hypothetical protein